MEIDTVKDRRGAVLVAAEHGMGIWFATSTGGDRVVDVQVGVKNLVPDVYDFAGLVDAEELRSMTLDDFRAMLETVKLEWVFK